VGRLFWEELSRDEDYNFQLLPQCRAGVTIGDRSPSVRTIGLEFDSRETIDLFTEKWWVDFHKRVDNDHAKAEELINGRDAIVIGQFGLDCEHGCYAELHPVYAMAIHVNDDANQDQWAVFARNFGNEGYCSADEHPLVLPTGSLKLRFSRPGARFLEVVATSWKTTDDATIKPPAFLSAGDDVVLNFELPKPETRPLIEGLITLRWSGGGSAHLAPVHSTGTEQFPQSPSEEALKEAFGSVPAGGRGTVDAALRRAAPVHDVPLPPSSRSLSPLTAPGPAPSIAPGGVDQVKLRNDLSMLCALCKASSGTRSPPLCAQLAADHACAGH
jgi:hypothetical protein